MEHWYTICSTYEPDNSVELDDEKKIIMQTCPCNVDPLTPHFYIVKLGFTGVFIFSYLCSKT